MKIIGTTPNGYIFEATTDEVANLLGYYSSYSAGFRSSELKPGDQIRISKLYEQLYQQAANRNTIGNLRSSLTALADLLAPIEPVIHETVPDISNA